MADRPFDLEEAARVLGCTPAQVRRMIRAGDLQARLCPAADAATPGARLDDLETEVARLRRALRARTWALEALLFTILLLVGTAWVLWRA